MELTVRIRPPHEKQRLIRESGAKRKIVRAGRRSGKTVGISGIGSERFLGGARVLYAAPTEFQVSTFWTEVKLSMAELIHSKVLRKNEVEHMLEFTHKIGGPRIRAKTAWNADTLRGDYADLLILDEFQMMNESAWKEVGAPMLLDNDGDAVLIYTPLSRTTRALTKARDYRYASKLYERAEQDRTGRWEAFTFTSHDNPYLNDVALDEIAQDMTNVAYRQEILAEELDEVPGALWTREMIENNRVDRVPPGVDLLRAGIGVDPPGGSTECGIVAAGLGSDGHAYVIDDVSLQASPDTWAGAVIDTCNLHLLDFIVGERNYGGDMVKNTITGIEGGDRYAYKEVSATRGKAVRAQPIAARYERGEVHHVGSFTSLEDELCTWIPDAGMPSPNRLDALVWILSSLMLQDNRLLVGFG